MKSFSVLCVLFASVVTITDAQLSGPNEFFVRGGMVYPVSPQSFTDYWKNGFAFGAGVGMPFDKSTSLLISLDYARFSFDQARLLRYFSLPAAGNSISGASTALFLLSAHFKVSQLIFESVPIYVSGGVGLAYSTVAATTVTYSDYSATAQPISRLSVDLAPGIGLEYPLQDRFTVFAEARHYWAVLRKADANAGFSQLSIGFRSAL